MSVWKFGHNSAIGGTFSTLWDNGATIYVYPAAATVMQVSSSDTDDTSAGDGARTVRIIGLDANWNEVSEDVILNGQSQVATSTEFLRVYRMKVLTAGASLWNEGFIYVGTGSPTTGKPAVVHGLIEPFMGQSLMALYTIPAGFQGVLMESFFSSAISKQVGAGIFTREEGGVFHIDQYHSLVDGISPLPRTRGHIFAPKTDIEARARAGGAGGDIGCQFEIELERI